MSNVLLLSVSGILQSYGDRWCQSRKTTTQEISKSSFIGMCASSMGVDFDEYGKEETRNLILELSSVKFLVRIDREGSLLQDF